MTVDILKAIPHRSPFLLVDDIVELPDSNRLVGIKTVSVNDPYVQGYYPDRPTMPHSLILEAMAQTSTILIKRQKDTFDRTAIFVGADKVSFKHLVVPGQQIRLEMETKKVTEKQISLEGNAVVDGKIVASALLKFDLVQGTAQPSIHSTASVHPTAILGKDVTVGPYTTIGENVIIGDRTIIEAHVMIEKWTTIGEDCHIHFGSVIGSKAQDIKYKGEKSWVVIGDRNEIREYVTINRATGKDQVTQIGNDNILLTNVHIGHNCVLGNNIVMANACALGGHCEIEDRVTIGGLTGVHQFVRIGKGCMIGGYSRIIQDVPPFMLCDGNPAAVQGLNAVGLRRNGISKSGFAELKAAHKSLYRSKLNTKQAIEEVNKSGIESEEGRHLLTFLKTDTKRGISKKPSDSDASSE